MALGRQVRQVLTDWLLRHDAAVSSGRALARLRRRLRWRRPMLLGWPLQNFWTGTFLMDPLYNEVT